MNYLLFLFVFTAQSLMGSLPVAGEGSAPRQYYSGWQKHPSKSYHYRRLYYKPTANYVGCRHHYVIYNRKRPDHVYFYNPYTKRYWGRCGVSHQGRYSLLADADRRESLEEIPESAFPEPGEPPLLPEATDGVRLDLPPDDLPLD